MSAPTALQTKINTVIYVDSGTLTRQKKQEFFAAAHGYTYDVSVDGRKKLVKNVPTTTGYYTGGVNSTTTVVIPIDIFSCTYSHAHSELSGVLIILKALLEHHVNHEETPFHGLAVVTRLGYLDRLLKADLKSIRGNENRFQRIELSEEDLTALNDVQQLLKQRGDKTLLWVDGLSYAEGGFGVKKVNEELSIAETLTLYDRNMVINFDFIPVKEYENPETDLNKIISASRWYFNTGVPADHYELRNGYRAYYFGKVDKDKKYYGKVTPDVTYCAYYTKTPCTYLDKLYEFAKNHVKNPKELLMAGNMQYMNSKDVVRLVDSYPAVNKGKDLIVPFKVGSKEDPTLIELIDPPALSYLIVETNFNLDTILHAFLNKDEENQYKEFQHFINITDLIYKKDINKKGDVKLKLQPDFKQTTLIFKIDATHRLYNAKIPVTLGVGYDLPDRNSFNSVTDPDVEVWVNIDCVNETALTYRTIVKTKDWIYVHTTAKGVNIRVLNTKELATRKS